MEKATSIKTIKELKEFLKNFFKNREIKIFLFGSRARGNSSRFSDIDIGFLSNDDISKELSLLREIIENCNIPYKVDIVNLSENKELLKVVLNEGQRWL